jgi:hypothetical protein
MFHLTKSSLLRRQDHSLRQKVRPPNLITKKKKKVVHPVILATQEAEIRRIMA